MEAEMAMQQSSGTGDNSSECYHRQPHWMSLNNTCARSGEVDLYASSVSSADLSPGPTRTPARPDSPRPLLTNAAKMRFQQLVVWGDAAEEQREPLDLDLDMDMNSNININSNRNVHHHNPTSALPRKHALDMARVGRRGRDYNAADDPARLKQGGGGVPWRRQPDRVGGTTTRATGESGPLSRRKSLFVMRPSEAAARRPSLWGRGMRCEDRGKEGEGEGGRLSLYAQVGMGRRRNSRRAQSFHRYSRIAPDGTRLGADMHARAWGMPPSSDERVGARGVDGARGADGIANGIGIANGNGAKDEFDDLVDGLEATKVTETRL